MKKVIKWIAIVVGVLVCLVIIAGIVLMFVVSKDMVAGQMESVLNRQVRIEDVDVNIFSVVSGVEVKGVTISNHKTPDQLEALKGKPVAKNDLFTGLKSLNLQVKFFPLLRGRFELSELTLNEPVINIVKYRNGKYNFSDLLEAKKPAEGEAASSKPKEPAEPKPGETEKPAKAFSADDLPVSITLGAVGIDKGTVHYEDMGVGQAFEVYDLTFLAHSAEIDPSDLEKKDIVKLKFHMGVKPVGRVRSGAVKSFDILLNAKGSMKPFDVKTRLLDPELNLNVGSSKGTMTGLQIFEAIQSIRVLEPYTGKLSFLKDKVEWKDAELDVWYKNNIAKISGGKIATGDVVVHLSGTTNIKTKAVNLNVKMDLSEKNQKAIEAAVAKNIKREIRGDVAKYIPPEKITQLAMKRLKDKNGKIYFEYDVGGTTRSPSVKLIHPKVPPLSVLIKDVGGDATGIAQETLKQEGNKAIKKGLGDLQNLLNRKLK